jgi:hypothetical protein
MRFSMYNEVNKRRKTKYNKINNNNPLRIADDNYISISRAMYTNTHAAAQIIQTRKST